MKLDPNARILIVDDEADIREIVRMAVESESQIKIDEASSGNEAIELIKKNKEQYLAVFCDYRMPRGNGGLVFQYLLQNHPGIIFVLVSAHTPNELPEFKDSKVKPMNILKPDIFDSVRTHLNRMLGTSVSKPKTSDEGYIHAFINLLRFMNPLPTDVFIRLSDSKFVRILKAGDSFTVEDLHKYREKNVVSLWIKRDDGLNAVRALQKKVIDSSHVRVALPQDLFDFSEANAQIIQTLFTSMGMSEETVQLVRINTESALASISQFPELTELLTRLKFGVGDYFSEHTALFNLVLGALALKTEFNGTSALKSFSIAVLLHDLWIEPSKLPMMREMEKRLSNPEHRSIQEIQKFMMHPSLAAQSIREKMPDAIDAANLVEFHHENPIGTGFPKSLAWDKTYGALALFVIAQDLVDELLISQEPATITLKKFFSKKGDYYSRGEWKRVYQKLCLLYQAEKSQ